jgi:hypothetical protein
MRVKPLNIFISALVPFSVVLMTGAACFWISFTLNFSCVPYNYRVEGVKGVLQSERTLDCPKWLSPQIHFGPAIAFEQDYYDQWSRAHKDWEFCGIRSYYISYVLSREATAVDPQLAVTPANLFIVPFSWLLFISCIPALILGIGFLARKRHRPDITKRSLLPESPSSQRERSMHPTS